MSYNVIFTQGTATFTVPAGEKVAVEAYSPASVFQEVGYPNFPETQDLLQVVENTTYVSAAFTNATSVTIQAGASGALYSVGTEPVVSSTGKFQLQGTPGVLNATGALTSAMILAGIVTSSTAAAVVATLPTGTVLDAASEFAIGGSFDWSVINTGPDSFTVTAATDHTVVGVAAVSTLTSVAWRTRKTAANVFVSYRIG